MKLIGDELPADSRVKIMWIQCLKPKLLKYMFSLFIAGLQPEVKGRSAPRPNELPLRHTTSTDMLTNVESQEEQNYEPQLQHEGCYSLALSALIMVFYFFLG